MKERIKKRCPWLNVNNNLYTLYHDTEWGVPVHDDTRLFEMLILEGAQAGLSWETILKKRDNYRIAFHGFDVQRCTQITEKDESKLMTNEGIVRNRLKIASVRTNALAFSAIQKKYGSFNAYLWGFVHNSPINKRYKNLLAIETSDELSDCISRDLKKRGMKFVGSTIIYAYMQAIGMINAHTTDCFRNKEIEDFL